MQINRKMYLYNGAEDKYFVNNKSSPGYFVCNFIGKDNQTNTFSSTSRHVWLGTPLPHFLEVLGVGCQQLSGRIT